MDKPTIERKKVSWADERRPWKMYYLISKPNQLGNRYLLYVGITSQGVDRNGWPLRWKEHETDALEYGNRKILWWPHVDKNYSAQYTRDHDPAFKSEAEKLENAEIRRLKPKHNTAGHVRPAFGVYRPFKPKWLNASTGTDLDGSKVAFLTVIMVCVLLLAYWVWITTT